MVITQIIKQFNIKDEDTGKRGWDIVDFDNELNILCDNKNEHSHVQNQCQFKRWSIL